MVRFYQKDHLELILKDLCRVSLGFSFVDEPCMDQEILLSFQLQSYQWWPSFGSLVTSLHCLTYCLNQSLDHLISSFSYSESETYLSINSSLSYYNWFQIPQDSLYYSIVHLEFQFLDTTQTISQLQVK